MSTLVQIAISREVSDGGVKETEFGTREFATLDADGNLLTFFRWDET